MKSLQEIWSTNRDTLAAILTAHDHTPSASINLNRITAADIARNALPPQDTFWVMQPTWMETMLIAPTLSAGVEKLREPYVQKVRTLMVAFHLAATLAQDLTVHSLQGQPIVGAGLGWHPRLLNDLDLGIGSNVQWALANITQAVIRRDLQPSDTRLLLNRQAARTHTTRVQRADAVWRSIIEDDAVMGCDYQTALTFDPADTKLLEIDISAMVPRARCYYMYAMWDMYREITLALQVKERTTKYGCEVVLTERPLNIPLAALPFLQPMGALERDALRILIGEYAGRPCTRAEMMQLLLQL